MNFSNQNNLVKLHVRRYYLHTIRSGITIFNLFKEMRLNQFSIKPPFKVTHDIRVPQDYY